MLEGACRNCGGTSKRPARRGNRGVTPAATDFTSGAIVRGELHLLPLAALRERGVLERTIRHELVHALTDDAFAGRPLWVREGAAVYFADPREEASSAPRHEKCPDDAEFARPVSIGALANAYARARACFARQIAQGRRWNDVK